MTSVASYRLLQCSSCGQKHILPNYGTLNFTFSDPPKVPKPQDLRVCQRCSVQRPLKDFIPLRTIYKPRRDNTPKWFKPIRKLLDKNYQEPEPHPAQLYPDLEATPFDPDTWMPEWARKRMRPEDFPDWYAELAQRFEVSKGRNSKGDQ